MKSRKSTWILYSSVFVIRWYSVITKEIIESFVVSLEA